MNKRCRKCTTEKPIEQFHKNTKRKDGFSDWCKACAANYNAVYYIKRGRSSIPRRSSNMAEIHARARLRKKGVECDRLNYDAIMERDGMICHICGYRVEAPDLSFDHIMPIAAGGDHIESNVSVAHLLCNQRKGTKSAPLTNKMIQCACGCGEWRLLYSEIKNGSKVWLDGTERTFIHGHTSPPVLAGEQNGAAKLTEERVRTIRAKYAAGGYSQRYLAREYGVSQKLILLIVHGQIWKHVSQVKTA